MSAFEDRCAREDEEDRLTALYGCPKCGGPVSVDGRARSGLLLHECPTHGWVQPLTRAAIRADANARLNAMQAGTWSE